MFFTKKISIYEIQKITLDIIHCRGWIGKKIVSSAATLGLKYKIKNLNFLSLYILSMRSVTLNIYGESVIKLVDKGITEAINKVDAADRGGIVKAIENITNMRVSASRLIREPWVKSDSNSNDFLLLEDLEEKISGFAEIHELEKREVVGVNVPSQIDLTERLICISQFRSEYILIMDEISKKYSNRKIDKEIEF